MAGTETLWELHTLIVMNWGLFMEHKFLRTVVYLLYSPLWFIGNILFTTSGVYISESTESTTSCQYMEYNTHLLPQKQGWSGVYRTHKAMYFVLSRPLDSLWYGSPVTRPLEELKGGSGHETRVTPWTITIVCCVLFTTQTLHLGHGFFFILHRLIGQLLE